MIYIMEKPQAPQVEDENKEINYNKEYKEHRRCPACNRKSNGVKDYQSKRSPKITKTCVKCRISVLKSLKKKPQPRKPTQKETIKALYDILNLIHNDVIKTAIKDKHKLKPFILSRLE
jgi:hypothetical protein